MSDNDNGRRFHITLNKLDIDALDFVVREFGFSRSAGIRASIRAAAKNMGYKNNFNNCDKDTD